MTSSRHRTATIRETLDQSGLRWRSNTLFIISTVAVGLFTDLFLYGLVVPILPFMLQTRANIPRSRIQTHVSGLLAAYAGASVLSSPPAGVIADKVRTRRMPFLLGVLALLGATAIFAFGQSVTALVIARVLQGVSAAVVWTVGLAMVLDTVGSGHLGKTIGSIFGFISIGELAAPVLGGVLYEKSGYGGVFGLGFALLAVDLLMRVVVLEKRVARKYGLYNEDNDGGHDHFNESEHNSSEEEPLLSKSEEKYKVPDGQPGWLRAFPVAYILKEDPRLIVGFLCAFIHATLLASFDATIPTFAEEQYGFNSLDSGLLFVALVLPYLLLGPVFGWFVDKYGPKPVGTAGFAFLVPVMILLRLPHVGGTSQIILYCAILALCGVGLGAIGSISIVETSHVVQMYDKANQDSKFFGEQGPYAQLYGLNSMVFSAGLTLGPLLAGALKNSLGYGNANMVLAIISGLTSVLVFTFVGGPPQILQKWRRSRELCI